MPHHCIVPQCTNNSSMPGLSFHRLPLHNENLLTKWLVNIKRVNTPVNEYSCVCSEHFEGGKKKGKDDIPTIFAWSKTTKPRPAPKERENPVGTSLTHHSIGIMAKLHPENNVSTCTTDLAKLYTEDKEILVKPAVVSVENNTDFKVFSDAATNTDVMQKGDASAQTEVPVTKYCDASIHRPIVIMAVIIAYLYVLSKFRIIAMLLSFILDFLHFSF